MSDEQNNDQGVNQLLEVLSACYPAPMNFSNILGAERAEEELKSGFLAQLLSEGLIEPHGKAKFSFRMTEFGKSLMETKTPPTLDEELEKMMMPSLQPHNWEHKLVMLCEPLLENGDMTGELLPLLTFGMDKPEVFEPIHKTEKNQKHYNVFKKAALKNIIDAKVVRNEVDMGVFKMTVVSGSYYAAEKVLDREYMKKIQTEHGYGMLAVALPRKGTMYITDGLLQPEIMAKFMMVAAMKHGENEQTKPLTTGIFIVKDGKLSGVIKAKTTDNDTPSASDRKKSIWSRIFKN